MEPKRFYTHCAVRRNHIYLRGYSGDKRIEQRIAYEPTLYVPDSHGEFRTIDGHEMRPMKFDSMAAAREFLSTHESIHGMKIHGNTSWPYAFLNEHYPGRVDYDPDQISVVSVDIECAPDEGEPDAFPDIATADQPITLVTLRRRGRSVTFGCEPYTDGKLNVQYVLCRDERELLLNLLLAWNHPDWAPDVATGWNVEFFDVPYLVNRIRVVLGEDSAKRLSPWHVLEEREIESQGSKKQAFIPLGITVLDYMALYKKFCLHTRESYSLDYIASEELGEKKLDYSEYGSLTEMRRQNWELYVDYNIHDCALVDRLEEKLGYIRLVFALAYNAKVNYTDTLHTVRQWDSIIHNSLLERKVVVPLQVPHEMPYPLVGGYVKDPIIGMHEWVVGIDLDSLYSHLQMQYNISPETFIGKVENFPSIGDILDGALKDVVPEGATIAANGCMYRKEPQGFLPALLEEIYNGRVEFKRKKIEAEREFERTKDPEAKKRAVLYDTFQGAYKVLLNSAYGALANRYYRWFSFDNAEAVTTSGQLAIRWIAKKLNEFMNDMLKTTDVDYIVASDTDSVYLNLGPLVKRIHASPEDTTDIVDRFCRERILPFIGRSYEELAELTHARSNKMRMKIESVSDKAIWRGTKMYILNVRDSEGVRYAEPKLKIVGIEAVRSSTPQVCREHIKRTIGLIMTASKEEVREYIENFRREFMEMSFDQVAFPRGVKLTYTRISSNGVVKIPYGLEDKSLPIQVRGSLVYNEMIHRLGLEGTCPKIYDGSKIRFAYMKVPNPSRSDVLACPGHMPSELGIEPYIDRELQFVKSFIGPIKSIMDAIGWEIEEKATLEEFFS